MSGKPQVANRTSRPDYDFLAKPFALQELATRAESLTGFRGASSDQAACQ
jgi:hypothetical protein